MKAKKSKPASKRKQHVLHEAEGVASGAIAGAVVGAAAGPPGVVAGAVLGGAAGAAAARALENDEARHSARTRELDEEIGVMGGDLGAPNLKHPPARIGAYSLASAGAGGGASSDDEPAEGPIATPKK
jgi:hypothetical protein